MEIETNVVPPCSQAYSLKYFTNDVFGVFITSSHLISIRKYLILSWKMIKKMSGLSTYIITATLCSCVFQIKIFLQLFSAKLNIF